MAYNADGQLLTLTAYNPTTENQATKYVYGTTLTESKIARVGSVACGNLPGQRRHGIPPWEWQRRYFTTVLSIGIIGKGNVPKRRTKNGTVHAFEFDKLGRQTHDRVTTLGAGRRRGGAEAFPRVRGAWHVGQGRKLRQRDGVARGRSSTTVTFEFDSLALLTKEYQEHSGGQGRKHSLRRLQLRHHRPLAGLLTKGSRATSVRYPNGRLVFYDYASSGSTADAINRIDAIKDNSGGSPGATLAAYSYLGQGGIVQVDYQEPDIRFDLAFGAGSDPYDGLDRFDPRGRSSLAELLQLGGCGADQARLRPLRATVSGGKTRWPPPVAPISTSFMAMMACTKLKSRQRGDIDAGHTAISSKNFAEDWTLDMTGNWPLFRQDTDGNGTWDLNQSRTHDAANEITQIAGSSSHVAHDRAGNMTRMPKPDNWSAHYDLTFDAWNRLVKVMDGVTTVATYSYDGRNFRVSKSVSGTTRHFYFNNAWQCLEERLGASSYANRQYVYGLRYIDDLLLRDRDADGSSGTGSLGLSGSGLEERLYILQDPNWNVVAIANTSGTIQERFCYDAYGRSTVLTGAFGSRGSSSYDWEVRYTGRQFDKDTGFQENRNRWYGLQMGRWLSRDPIGYRAKNANLNEYLGNRPTSRVDPTGLFAKEPDPNEAPGDDIIETLDYLDTFIGIVEAIGKGGGDIGTLGGLMGASCELLQNQVLGILKALNKFDPKTPCGKWYKESWLAIEAASRGDGTGCARIATTLGSSGSNNSDKCLEAIESTGQGSLPAQTAFAAYSRKVSRDCAKVARKKCCSGGPATPGKK